MRPGHARRLAVLVLLAAGCGDGPEVDTTDVRDPDEGTGTLLLEAHVKGEATAPNAVDPAEFRTRIVVRVARAGRPVVDAAVRVNGLALVHRGEGVYGEPVPLVGPPPALVAVAAVAGGDWIRAACASPGPHAFTRPARAGEALAWSVAAPLEIAWMRASRADSAAVDVGRFSRYGDIDEGTLAIPPGALGLRPPASVSVGLWRENQVRLAGGAAGSLLSVSMWNGLQATLRRD